MRLAALFFLCLAVQAQALLDLAPGPRSAALGEAFSTVPGSAESVWMQPALAPVSRSVEATLGYLPWIQGVGVQSFCMVVGDGRIGGAVMGMLGQGDDVQRDASGNDIGSIRYQSQLFGVAVGAGIPSIGLAFGTAFKYRAEALNASVASPGQGPADQAGYFDAGFTQAFGDSGLRASMGIRDFSWTSYNRGGWFGYPEFFGREPQIRAGAAFNFFQGKHMILAEAVHHGFSQTWTGHLGYEILPWKGSLQTALRAGYHSGLAGLGAMNGASLGLGLGWQSYWLDYAYVPLGDFGASHRWSVRGNWSIPPRPPRKAQPKAVRRQLPPVEAPATSAVPASRSLPDLPQESVATPTPVPASRTLPDTPLEP